MKYDDDREPRHRKLRLAPRRRERELIAAPEEAGTPFAMDVQVTKTERAWIAEHLLPFREACLIDDVVGRIKAGKEATVYVCSTPPQTGGALVAAKLYRAQSLRGAKNTNRYELGRSVLNAEGQVARARAWRLHKAIAQGSKKGQVAAQTSWLMHEYLMLETLHANGAHVPRPIAHNEFALLMEFVGAGGEPAPTLNEVALDGREAKRLFERLVFDLELLLSLGWVHGDLSAHNVLYQPGRAILIDFPQVVDCQENPEARAIFERDLARIAQYFARAGLSVDHRQLAEELWSKHVPRPESST